MRTVSTFALILVSSVIASLPASALDRPADPVVMIGADVPSLDGIATGDLVAFRYTGSWVQIPVQVDERATLNSEDAYNGSYSGLTKLDYTDSGTFVGPDPDPLLDSDDEIVFMVKDAGNQATTFSEPAGVVADSGIEVEVADPLGGDPGYVYLFERSGSLDPDAGQQYVSYTFDLLSGDYMTTYDLADGPNPEDSTITTAYYERHFSDRWVYDELRILAGSATGVDILDRHKNMFGPGSCGRTEDTFVDAEGAFIINKSGPVRAIRSYFGANSGPRTQRQHVYYERREDTTTFLRVHSIPGVMDFYDYAPAASGMTYFNNNNLTGVTIDGVPDTVTQGVLTWELVRGAQGSLAMTADWTTDIAGLTTTSYYYDDAAPSVTQCTGDAFSYGSSGMWVNTEIDNTDPASTPYYIFEGLRTTYYEAPGLSTSEAALRRSFIDNPLELTMVLWDSTVDSDGDGEPDVTDAFPANADETQDTDGDGLGDNFEQTIIDYDGGDGFASFADVTPGDDFDNDGVSNITEFTYRTDPTDGTTQLPVAGAVALAALVLVLGGIVVARRTQAGQAC
ncbi:MAG: hypothetical protein GY851_07100 [bacterium]|nr:hypothetical protein [bacterium]